MESIALLLSLAAVALAAAALIRASRAGQASPEASRAPAPPPASTASPLPAATTTAPPVFAPAAGEPRPEWPVGAAPADAEMVLTPGGPRHRDLVHAVQPGEDVRKWLEGAAPALNARKTVSARALDADLPEDYVITPGGPRHRAHVHQVEPGMGVLGGAGGLRLLDRRSGETKALVEPEALDSLPVPQLGSGWIAYAYWNNGTASSITSFRTTWQVPPAPATGGRQTLFLFNGIQNYGANFGILQPVLQWGPSAAGGGDYWAVASWYAVSNGTALYTPLVRVNPGDTLVGVMTLAGVNWLPGILPSFDYLCRFEGMPQTLLSVQNIAQLLWCNQTLEAYQVRDCSQYPDTGHTSMGQIEIQTGSTVPPLSWAPVNAVTDCGQHAVVVSNSPTAGQVDLYYR
ncbi:MAG TPA: hypothetical protein VHG93_26565 [Longimicrobium sp.]|nr:hypothetical protein [Longimicrobium sp.]